MGAQPDSNAFAGAGPLDARAVLAALVSGKTLNAADAEAVFSAVLEGQFDAVQIGALLTAIAQRGPRESELIGGARAMRRCVTPVAAPAGRTLVDTCGTGGAPKTFNVSTLAAIAVAAAAPGRVGVAKHGGRSRSGRGSAELMQALGVPIETTPAQQARALREVGLCFCFAPRHHPAMKHAAPVRAALGFPTIFNLLGPLTNPAGVERQLIGAMSRQAADLLSGALAGLGTARSVVAWSKDGLDELSVTSGAVMLTVEGPRVRAEEMEPESLGLKRARIEDIAARDLDDAVAIARDVLDGRASARLDTVALNAGAALFVAGAAGDLGEGLEIARGALRAGRGRGVLEGLIRVSREPAE